MTTVPTKRNYSIGVSEKVSKFLMSNRSMAVSKWAIAVECGVTEKQVTNAIKLMEKNGYKFVPGLNSYWYQLEAKQPTIHEKSRIEKSASTDTIEIQGNKFDEPVLMDPSNKDFIGSLLVNTIIGKLDTGELLLRCDGTIFKLVAL